MMIKTNLAFFATMAMLTLSACKVETKTESVPEAEGSGKKAINIRVEPMSRDEMKSAASNVIDKTAEVATSAREAATSAVQNAEHIGQAVTTLSDTMINIRRQPDNTATTSTN